MLELLEAEQMSPPVYKHFSQFLARSGLSLEELSEHCKVEAHKPAFLEPYNYDLSGLHVTFRPSNRFMGNNFFQLEIMKYHNRSSDVLTKDYSSLIFHGETNVRNENKSSIVQEHRFSSLYHFVGGPAYVKDIWVDEARVPTQYRYFLYGDKFRAEDYKKLMTRVQKKQVPVWLEAFRTNFYINIENYINFIDNKEVFDEVPIDWVLKLLDFEGRGSTGYYSDMCTLIEAERKGSTFHDQVTNFDIMTGLPL